MASYTRDEARILSLFDGGYDTAQIGKVTNASEAEVTKYLHQALAKRRASGSAYPKGN